MKKETRGGKRENSGAKPKGNVQYQRRIKPELVQMMDEYLNKLKAKSLQGIENNNGWIKIESECDIEICCCFFITKKGNTYLGKTDFIDGECFFIKGAEGFTSNFITYYQPIIKPKHPIY